ncbi:MAG: hypothetical protein ACE5I1_30990, partial [bacterium]
MQCEFYKKHELGEIDEVEFRQHRQNCQVCDVLLQQDEKLFEAAASLSQIIEAPLLWGKIENQLREEQHRERSHSDNFKNYFTSHKTVLFRFAAILIVTTGVAAYFFSQTK